MIGEMMKTAHTPAPWRAVFRGMDQDANWASRIPYAIERAVGSAVQPIADICDQPQAEANARLIAAAPELLAAVRAFLAYNAGDGDLVLGYETARKLAIDAYAKAVAAPDPFAGIAEDFAADNMLTEKEPPCANT